MANLTETTMQRQRLLVQGLVQGVGFRPFIYGLALRLDLGGFVLNDSEGVTIEIEGSPEQLVAFHSALHDELPPLARVDSLVTALIPTHHESAFRIVHSQAGGEKHALISPDSATCPDCLHELFDPHDRRYRYPFINCTNCGPRFTIVKDVPYDRDQTTMAVFPMCPACRVEYEDPLNRRFHAQPNACPVCGPQVRLLAQDGQPLEVADPIEAAARQLAGGAILAIKGLGGYHLACDALDEAAVARLRSRKHREAKPFALMVPDLAVARQLCELNEAEEKLLQARQRPVVLLLQRPGAGLAPAVAPNYHTLGLMLPYTPLHYLLLDAFKRVVGLDRPAALVMTSGNMSDEPIAYRDGDATTRLAPVADGWLTHNREIHMRCDDSVVRVLDGSPQFFRRSRGYAPEPLRLNRTFARPVLACGGHLKNTFCLAKERQAFVSHHIGDLENLETLTSFREGIAHYERLFDITPQVVAYDLHPDYLATRYALDLDLPHKIGVQHHHAHIASVLAEHGLTGPVIGVAADGTGYGGDGTIWGCEIMLASLLKFERLAHLAYIPLPGGDRAVRQPWRVAASLLTQVYGENFLDLEIPFARQLDPARWKPLAQMITRGVNSPLASSLGRLFDGVSALVGLRQEVVYEGQAAIELEALALPADRPYPFSIKEGQPAILDVGPLLRAIVDDLKEGVPAGLIAGRFHRSIAELLAAVCRLARAQTGLNEVALSGGVFQNRLLLEQLLGLLEEAHFTVYRNCQVPPNDGGLSLGQAVVAAARLET
ncbi:MAG: carbamoyltransferase HypF [Chloroflexi bacterium]|nr:carbamoyltransferase HypF [Chloroflexota bacterium]OJW02763.1 MAG: carbamoyltransferase HypF [Chloroflexi bacterium 54-19]